VKSEVFLYDLGPESLVPQLASITLGELGECLAQKPTLPDLHTGPAKAR
jgi:hypothetical protein